VRCCGLAEYLAAQSLGLHGIILLGSAIDFSTLEGDRKDILPDSLLIPTFAATAWYHGRLWPEGTIEQVTDYARRFLYEEYLPFMIQPTRLGQREQNAFYSKLSELIGLKSETVRRYLGRFDEILFTTEFMGLERKVIGGLDTRYVGDLSSLRRVYMEDDPSYKDMLGISCAFNAYLQKELDTFRPFEKYALFTNRHFWNFNTYDSTCWPEVFQRLRRTLVWNPSMKIFSGSGYYDCRTPFAATEYCFQHLELPASYLRSFQFEYYEGGHGFVFDLPCLKKLKKDLIAFYERHLD
jgi:carboxypeptidase C (cathepsin A)